MIHFWEMAILCWRAKIQRKSEKTPLGEQREEVGVLRILKHGAGSGGAGTQSSEERVLPGWGYREGTAGSIEECLS